MTVKHGTGREITKEQTDYGKDKFMDNEDIRNGKVDKSVARFWFWGVQENTMTKKGEGGKL